VKDEERRAKDEKKIKETEWLQAATSNPAFDFLKDQEEEIYTLDDGKPFTNGTNNDNEHNLNYRNNK